MPDSRTNSSVAERLDLHIERLPNRLHRRRRYVTLACGLAPLLLLAVLTLRGDHTIYMSRPVATSHQPAQADCKNCHRTPWQPLVRLARFDNQVRSVQDTDCQQCHRQSKHDHNPLAITKGVPDCAVCHREHRGRQRLTERADEFCIKCHAPWEEHPEVAVQRPRPSAEKRTESDETMYRHLLGIAEFRESTSNERGARWIDRAKLHFNHQNHLKPLSAVWNKQVDSEVSPKTVQLHCNDCHQADASGAYMRPILFERHCQSCHPLRFSGKLSNRPLPHEKPEIVRGVLRDRLIDYLREHPEELIMPSARSPSRLPNKSAPSAAKDKWSWLEDESRVIENAIFQTAAGTGDSPKNNACQKCHVTSTDTSSVGFQIVAPRIPSRWLAHSRFDPGRHRDVACVDCHHVESGTNSLGSTSVEDILIPKLEICRDCHGATRALPTQRYGRKNCVECHQFHHDSKSVNTDATSH